MINELSFFFEAASTAVYSWLIIALLFLVFEVLNPGLFFFLSFSAGSFFAAAIAWNELPLTLQCFGFIAISIVTFFLLRWYFKPRLLSPESRTGVDALIGKEATVLEPVSSHQSGRVKIRFESWPAITQGKHRFEKGDVVHVIGVKGNHVIVSH